MPTMQGFTAIYSEFLNLGMAQEVLTILQFEGICDRYVLLCLQGRPVEQQ